jgi:hypothetical protein
MNHILDYLKRKPCLRDRVLDHGELKRVAKACGLSPQEARSELRKLGFTLTRNNHGIAIWMKQTETPIIEAQSNVNHKMDTNGRVFFR